MTQINLTLESELLKGLSLHDGDAIKKLVDKVEAVIRIFPNTESILRLMGAILMDLHEQWSQRRYMDLSSLSHWEAERERATAPMSAEGK